MPSATDTPGSYPDDIFDDSRMGMEEHINDALRCVAIAFLLPLLVTAISAVVLQYQLPSSDGGPRPDDGDDATLTHSLLWSLIIGSIAFHYAAMWQSLVFICAGLYPHEKRLIRVPVAWVAVVPAIACFSVYAVSTLSPHVPLLAQYLAAPDQTRAWLARSYVILMCTTPLLFLPRQIRTIRKEWIVVVAAGLAALPDHVFDSALVCLAGLWAGGLALICTRRIWKSTVGEKFILPPAAGPIGEVE